MGPYVSQDGGVSICEPRRCVFTVYVNREGVSVCVGVSVYEQEGGVYMCEPGRCVHVGVSVCD